MTFSANATAGQNPNLRASIDSTELLAMGIWPAAAANVAYTPLEFEFTATATSQTLSLANDNNLDDHTLLLDNFKIAPSNGRWSVDAWNDDSTIGVDANFFYTHAYSFANSSSFTVNGVAFTGIPGADPQQTSGTFTLTTVHFDNVYNGDTANTVVAAGAEHRPGPELHLWWRPAGGRLSGHHDQRADCGNRVCGDDLLDSLGGGGHIHPLGPDLQSLADNLRER